MHFLLSCILSFFVLTSRLRIIIPH
jgi:hypothetical protein